MDETSTSCYYVSDKVIRAAVKGGSYGTPSIRTIEFLRSFAASIRSVCELSGEAGVYSLN
ncbi:MAG: hypothetical protein IKS24_03880 [Bacteroidaceae bacterium]|nr:hypothetical protein [Bacteroidaceae bacterium]